MKSIIKVTIKHMKTHFGRGFMILFSIMLSTGLVYAVLNMAFLTEDIFKNNFLKDYGNSNVIVYNQSNELIEDNILGDVDANYIVSSNTLIGYTNIDSNYVVNMQSFTEEEFFEVYDATYIDVMDSDMNDTHIIIGEENHDRYELDIGDELDVTMNGTIYTFIVYGIVKEGFSYLDYNSNLIDIVITKEFVSDTLRIIYPSIYMVDLSNPEDARGLIELYEDYEVVDLLNNELYLDGLNLVSSFLSLMASSVILISGFIIFSTYKIIVIERLPFIGTLRSIGANSRFTMIALILESVIYGIVGGLLGIATGLVFLYGIIGVLFSTTGDSFSGIEYFNIKFALVAIATGIALSVCSSLVPIFKIRKFSIKQIMFSEIKNTKEMKYRNVIIGILFLVIAIVLVISSNYKTEMLFSILGTLLASIGYVLLIPILINIIAPVISFVLFPIFGNRVLISTKNIIYDKTLINNIALLATGLGVIFMINNFSRSVSEIVTEVYDDARFDLVISSSDIPVSLIDKIDNVEGVTNTYTVYEQMNIESVEGYSLPYVIGIDIEDYHDFAWYDFGNHISDDLVTSFSQNNTVIITNYTSNKYDLDIGDSYSLEYGGGVHTLEIIDTVESVLYNGNLNFISNSTYQAIYGDEGLKSVYIETNGENSVIKNKIKELYIYGVLPVESLDDMEKTNQDTNSMMFSMMTAVSFLAMVIGAIGIINNFTVSFISRRKLIASLRSLGLSIRGSIYLFMVESLVIGIIGGLLGIAFGVVFYEFTAYVVEALGITSELMTYSIREIVFVFISGIVISLLAAIIPAWNISKRNIVQEIKYEG